MEGNTSTEKRIHTARIRAGLLAGIRGFFKMTDHLEVETPLLAPVRIPESHIEVFSTRYVSMRRGAKPLCLLPSPEVWMKRLLAAGFPSCFQITKSFRNAEQTGARHNPEFSMLEWYTAGADYMDSLVITKELLRAVGFDGKDLPDSGSAEIISVEDAFTRYAGIDLKLCGDLPAFQNTAAAAGYDIECTSWEECFNKLFLACVEPCFSDLPILFLVDYPEQIPCLAKKKGGGPWRERWELYIRGIETANCFTEETDAEAVKQFLETECSAGASSGPVPSDTRLAEISSRMPACSGVALGIDRLLMAVTGAENIQDVLLFPGGYEGA